MSAWTPVETGVQQICYLLAEVQKPGTNQAQVRFNLLRANRKTMPHRRCAARHGA